MTFVLQLSLEPLCAKIVRHNSYCHLNINIKTKKKKPPYNEYRKKRKKRRLDVHRWLVISTGKKKLKARQYMYICSIEKVIILEQKKLFCSFECIKYIFFSCRCSYNRYGSFFMNRTCSFRSIELNIYLLAWSKKRWKAFTQRIRSVTIYRRYSYLKIEGFPITRSSPYTYIYLHYPCLHPWRQSDNHKKKDDQKLDRQTYTHTQIFLFILSKKIGLKSWCNIIIKWE
jgi:hypothetical protein